MLRFLITVTAVTVFVLLLLGKVGLTATAIAAPFQPLYGERAGATYLASDHLYLPHIVSALDDNHLGYGALTASPDRGAPILKDMGFDWVKLFARPSDQTNPKNPDRPWENVDNQLDWIVEYQLERVLIRVREVGYAPPPRTPEDLHQFELRVNDLAHHVKEKYGPQLDQIAYEIWNEPNLNYEWGGQANVHEFKNLLCAAYKGIKAADPNAIVVSGGLSTGGDDNGINDLIYLERMYQIGAQGCLDAVGSHPYGGSTAASIKNPSNPIYFRRAEEQHDIMVAQGDRDRQIWATEVSWIVERPPELNCPQDEHTPFEVTEEQQGRYLREAYEYADREWPWMGPMFLLLDFHAQVYYDDCQPLRWYSIIHNRPPQSPRYLPAYYLLKEMEKHYVK